VSLGPLRGSMASAGVLLDLRRESGTPGLRTSPLDSRAPDAGRRLRRMSPLSRSVAAGNRSVSIGAWRIRTSPRTPTNVRDPPAAFVRHHTSIVVSTPTQEGSDQSTREDRSQCREASAQNRYRPWEDQGCHAGEAPKRMAVKVTARAQAPKEGVPMCTSPSAVLCTHARGGTIRRSSREIYELHLVLRSSL